ncbi:MAG: GNAT family protein [Clostridia bacterium]|nr:GNAT family protein [Clostridia bacterium]
MNRIQGEKITLREYRWEDLAEIRKWVVDSDTTRFLGSNVFIKPQSWEQTENYLRNILDGDAGANFVIADKESLAYLGQVNLMKIDSIARHAELGIVISRENQSKGYGREAVEMILKYGFEQLNLNRIYLTVDSANVRAIRVYDNVGFRHEGRLRENRYIDGQYHDTLIMGILRDEWRTVK